MFLSLLYPMHCVACLQLKRMFTWIDGDGDGYVTSSDLAQLGRDISPPAYIGSIMLTSSFAEYLLQEHGTSRCFQLSKGMFINMN